MAFFRGGGEGICQQECINTVHVFLSLSLSFPLQGLKLTFDSNFSPATGAKSGKVKAEFKHNSACVNADVDLNVGGPLVNAAAVVTHDGWLAGYQVSARGWRPQRGWRQPDQCWVS